MSGTGHHILTDDGITVIVMNIPDFNDLMAEINT